MNLLYDFHKWIGNLAKHVKRDPTYVMKRHSTPILLDFRPIDMFELLNIIREQKRTKKLSVMLT